MKITNDLQRQEYIERIRNLVVAVEAYDKAKAFHQGLENIQTEAKGSMDYVNEYQATKVMPGYPHNPNMPRGEDFFSHTKTMPEVHMKDGLDGLAAREALRADDLTPSETGMSPGRCPI